MKKQFNVVNSSILFSNINRKENIYNIDVFYEDLNDQLKMYSGSCMEYFRISRRVLNNKLHIPIPINRTFKELDIIYDDKLNRIKKYINYLSEDFSFEYTEEKKVNEIINNKYLNGKHLLFDKIWNENNNTILPFFNLLYKYRDYSYFNGYDINIHYDLQSKLNFNVIKEFKKDDNKLYFFIPESNIIYDRKGMSFSQSSLLKNKYYLLYKNKIYNILDYNKIIYSMSNIINDEIEVFIENFTSGVGNLDELNFNKKSGNILIKEINNTKNLAEVIYKINIYFFSKLEEQCSEKGGISSFISMSKKKMIQLFDILLDVKNDSSENDKQEEFNKLKKELLFITIDISKFKYYGDTISDFLLHITLLRYLYFHYTKHIANIFLELKENLPKISNYELLFISSLFHNNLAWKRFNIVDCRTSNYLEKNKVNEFTCHFNFNSKNLKKKFNNGFINSIFKGDFSINNYTGEKKLGIKVSMLKLERHLNNLLKNKEYKELYNFIQKNSKEKLTKFFEESNI